MKTLRKTRLEKSSNGMRAIAQAQNMAQAKASRLAITWDADTGWAGDSYGVKWARPEYKPATI